MHARVNWPNQEKHLQIQMEQVRVMSRQPAITSLATLPQSRVQTVS